MACWFVALGLTLWYGNIKKYLPAYSVPIGTNVSELKQTIRHTRKKKTRRFKEGDLVFLLLLGLFWTETTQIFCLPAELYHILPWNKYLYLDMQYV